MEDTTQAALDKLFEREEENYEELCQNVSILSQRGPMIHNCAPVFMNGHRNGITGALTEPEKKITETLEFLSLDNDSDNDDLSAEELDVGICIESQLTSGIQCDMVVPKLGNFVDDDSDENGMSTLSSLSSLDEVEREDEPDMKSILLMNENQVKEGSNEDVPDDYSKEDFNAEVKTKATNFRCANNCESSESSPFNVMMLSEITEEDKLPGEAADLMHAPGMGCQPQITNIEIKTRLKAPTQAESQFTDETIHVANGDLNPSDSCSDSIEKFKLDENFDYDNVVLTPRFPFLSNGL